MARTPRPGFEPGCPEGPGLAVQCNTKLCDRGTMFHSIDN